MCHQRNRRRKTPSVLWSLTNAAGTNVDPTKAGLAPVDLTKVTDEKVLGTALDSMRKQVTDPYLQQQATTEMESMVRHNQQMGNALQTQIFKQASDASTREHELRAIPPSVFAQLPAERQQQFKDVQTEQVLKNYHQARRSRRWRNRPGLGLPLEPDQLTPRTSMRAPNLANSTYLQLMGKATELQNNPRRDRSAGRQRQRKYYAEQSGVKTPDDKQTRPTSRTTTT